MIVCQSLSFACTCLFTSYILLSGLLSDLLFPSVPSLLVPCVTLLHTFFTHPLVCLLASLPSPRGLGCVSVLASREGRIAGHLDLLGEVEKTVSAQGPAVSFSQIRSDFT